MKRISNFSGMLEAKEIVDLLAGPIDSWPAKTDCGKVDGFSLFSPNS